MTTIVVELFIHNVNVALQIPRMIYLIAIAV